MKAFWKLLPYILTILVGCVLWFISNASYKEVSLGIATTAFSIVLFVFTYEFTLSFSNRKLNKNIHTFVRIKIPKAVFQVLTEIIALLEPNHINVEKFEASGNFIETIKKILHYSCNDIERLFREKTEYLGYFLFCDWECFLKDLDDILNNNLVIKFLDDEELSLLLDLHIAAENFIHER